MAPPWIRNTRSTWPREVPIARRMPISLDFWITDTTSTLAMPSATVRPTKTRISVLVRICAAHRREKLRVGHDPAFHLLVGDGADRLGDGFRRERIAHLDVDGGDAADEIEQVLRRAQRDVDVALVDALVAEIEDADDSKRGRGAGSGRQPELVADVRAEVLRQLGSDDDVERADVDGARRRSSRRARSPGSRSPARCR